MDELTAKQRKVLDFIADALNSGLSPTVREIAGAFKITIGPAQRYIKALEKKGYLKHTPGISRGIEVAWRKPMAAVPLLGRVPAGRPLTPYEDAEDYLYISKNTVKNGKCFALKVKGDSMTGAGINEGDTIVVRQQAAAENGEIVVAMVQGEATVKRLVRDKGEVYLKAENPAYSPIHAADINVIGKVIYLLREM